MRTTNFFSVCTLLSLFSAAHGFPEPSPAARVAPRAQPTSWSLPHRVTVGDVGTKLARSRTISSKRQSNVQIPWQFCPEFFGDDPKLCSDCGDDSKVKGTCDNLLVSGDQRGCPGNQPCRGYYCKCSDDGGPGNSPRVTMTNVLDGQTGTAIWEPMTLDNYKGLRASTTVTLAETATSTGGSELETVVAVVFAGGVAWYLASQSGSLAAAAAIQPPTQRPEGSEEDDKQCKNDPKEQCDDCGGSSDLGLCASGGDAGCPCDDQECPADGPPECSKPECSGTDDGLQCSASGKTKGCQCCPSTPPDCMSDECDADDDWKCKAEKFKGCGCEAELGPIDVVPDPDDPGVPSDDQWKKTFEDTLKKRWGGDRKNIPGYEEPESDGPWCLHGAAPSQPREPKSYCQCGEKHNTIYSVAEGPTACPWSPESTGVLVTWSTPPAPEPTSKPSEPEPTSAPPPEPEPSKPCAPDPYWCGAPFCGADPNCS